jgi:flavin-dependent dehydrogenase
VAALPLLPQKATGQPECRIGDALTMIAPVTGNGMSMAFEAAEIAVEPMIAYSRGTMEWDKARDTIAAECDSAFERRLIWASRLQSMLFSPVFRSPLASFILKSGRLWPRLFANTR